MDAIELLAQQLEQVQTSCNEMLELGSRTWQRVEAIDKQLFGNGQPGEIQQNKTALAGAMARITKLETTEAERRGGAQTWGAVAGALMWGIGMMLQWFWSRIKYGAH